MWLKSALWLNLIVMTVINNRDDYHHHNWESSPGRWPASLVWLMLMHQVILLLSSQGEIGKSKSDSTCKKVQSKLFYLLNNHNRERKNWCSQGSVEDSVKQFNREDLTWSLQRMLINVKKKIKKMVGVSSLKDQSDYFTRLSIWSYCIFSPGEI